MSIKYPIMTLNNESIVLFPGSSFSKNELKSRLHRMDIDASNIQDKNTLVKLYDSYLADHRNKIKIFDSLKKDTENRLSRLGMSERQSIQVSNANTMPNNLKNKVLNISISQEVKPFNNNNSRAQEKSFGNQGAERGAGYSNNVNYSFHSNISSQKQGNEDYRFGYNDNQMKNNFNNYNNNFSNSRNFQNNNQVNLTNSNSSNKFNNNNYNQNQTNYQQKYDNSMNSFNNSQNYRYNNINNNNTFLNNQKYQEEIKNSNINRNNNIINTSNVPKYQEEIRNSNNINMNNNITNTSNIPKYQEEIRNSNINRNNYNTNTSNVNKYQDEIRNSNVNRNNNTINYPKFQEENTNTDINRNNNSRYFQENSNNNQKIFTNITTPNPLNYQESMNSSIRSGNNNSNNYSNLNYNNSNFNNKNFNGSNINYSNSNYQNQQNNNNRMIIEDNNLLNEEELNQNRNNNNQNYKREQDEESAFSFFSTFQDFKNSPLYKNRKQICFNILISFLILIFAIGLLYFIFNCFESITNFFSEFFQIITDPRRFIQIILGFISTLLFGSVRYFYITIPLIVLIVLMFLALRKYIFQKRCREIIKKIQEYLNNNQSMGGNNIIYEDDIFKKFVQGYGISYEQFKKRYLKYLDKLRRDETNMKIYGQKINGKDILYWGLN